MRSAALFLAINCLATVGYANEDWDYATPHKNRCSEGPMLQMNACLADEYSEVEKRLNEAYLRLLDVLEDDPKTRLISAQYRWEDFRQQSCDYATSGAGKEGSLFAFAYHACMIDLTEKRILDLKKYWQRDCNGCPPRRGDGLDTTRFVPWANGEFGVDIPAEDAAHIFTVGGFCRYVAGRLAAEEGNQDLPYNQIFEKVARHLVSNYKVRRELITEQARFVKDLGLEWEHGSTAETGKH